MTAIIMDKENSTDLKILVGLGILALALMVFAPGFWLLYMMNSRPLELDEFTPATSVTSTEIQGRLGELGSTCGGQGHLPCRPGLQCSTGTDFSKFGKCEKSQDGAPQPSALSQLGEVCKYDFHSPKDCVPGLLCKMVGTSGSGTCAEPEGTDVNMLSVKLDGAEPVKGMYYVESSKGLGLTVTAVNAEDVKQMWDPDTGAKSEGTLLRQPGGVFVNPLRGSWQKVAGNLTVRAFAKNGDFMALDYRIATKE